MAAVQAAAVAVHADAAGANWRQAQQPICIGGGSRDQPCLPCGACERSQLLTWLATATASCCTLPREAQASKVQRQNIIRQPARS